MPEVQPTIASVAIRTSNRRTTAGRSRRFRVRPPLEVSSRLLRVESSVIPTDLAGLKIYLDDRLSGFYQDSARTNPVTADGQAVGAWSDNSGNSNHLIQSTGSKSPLYKTNIQNGRAMVLWDAVDDCLTKAALQLGTFTVIAVFKLTGTAGLLYEHGAGGGAEGSYLYGTTGYTSFIKRGTDATSKEYSANWAVDNAVKLVSQSYDGTHAGNTLRVNRVAVSLTDGAGGTADPGGTGISAAFNLGSRNNGASLPINGYIGEFLVYSPALSAANLALIEAYEQARWQSP